MRIRSSENTLMNFASIGMVAITLIVITGSVTDPINAPKFLLLGAVSVGTFSLRIPLGKSEKNKWIRIFQSAILLFLIWAFVSSFISTSPFSQNLYGVYGRNTGLFTYVFLGLLSLSISAVSSSHFSKKMTYAFLVAGAINLIYGSWVILFGDFVGWQNQYGALLGTFGNPNFISSFLGVLFSVVSVFYYQSIAKIKIATLFLLTLIGLQLSKANSIQGFAVAIIGVWLIFFYIQLIKNRKRILWFVIPSGIAAVAPTLGVFGIGPLSSILSQPTFLYRLEYWHAGIRMGLDNPLFGVGMDSYGDWYRFSRSEEALTRPGANVVTNVAHNVYLDIFSYGGFPLISLYVLINGLTLISILRYLKLAQKFDEYKISIIIIWVLYQVQSLISINQIGLAVWGWACSGIIISWLRTDCLQDVKTVVSNSKRKNLNQENLSSNLLLIPGIVLGLILSAPPLTSDIKWVNALKSRRVVDLQLSLTSSYFNPLNSVRISQAVQTLENSKLTDLAIEYARLGVKFNPRNTDAWKMVYYASKSSSQEKTKAKEKLIELDPRNEEWRQLP